MGGSVILLIIQYYLKDPGEEEVDNNAVYNSQQELQQRQPSNTLDSTKGTLGVRAVGRMF